MNFLGLDDVTIIRAEGVNMGPDMAAQAFETASAEIQALALKVA